MTCIRSAMLSFVVVAMAACSTGGAPSPVPPPGAFPGVEEADNAEGQLAALATPCAFNANDGGIMNINLAGGEYSLVARASSDSAAPLTVNGTVCGTAAANNTSRININSPSTGTTDELVILDFLNGSFALGTASAPGIVIDLRGGTADTVKIRGSSGKDEVWLATVDAGVGSASQYAMAVGIGAVPTGIRNIVFTGVESVTASTGPEDDIFKLAGKADAGIGGVFFGRTASGSGPSLFLYGGENTDSFEMGAVKTVVPVEIFGGPGTDTADFSARTAALTLTINAAGGEASEAVKLSTDTDIVSGGSAADTLACAAATACTLNGNGGNDTLTGSTGVDTINGGAGDDTVDGNTGGDTIDCGAGTADTITYASRAAAVTVTLGTPGTPTTTNGVASENDSLDYCENVIGGSAIDTFQGNDLDNVFTGNGGVDVLKGGAGNDTFVMPAASAGMTTGDTIDGEAGEDTVDYSARSTAVTVVLNTTTATLTNGASGEAASLVNVENAVGGSGGDTLTGDGADNRLEGGDGNDTIDGKGGNDIIVPGAGTNDVKCGAGNDILISTPGATDTKSDMAPDYCEG